MKIEKTVITCDGCGEVLYESGRYIASPYLEIKIDSPSGRRRGSEWTRVWPEGSEWTRVWPKGIYWFCEIACLGQYIVDKLVPSLATTYPVAAV